MKYRTGRGVAWARGLHRDNSERYADALLNLALSRRGRATAFSLVGTFSRRRFLPEFRKKPKTSPRVEGACTPIWLLSGSDNSARHCRWSLEREVGGSNANSNINIDNCVDANRSVDGKMRDHCCVGSDLHFFASP